MLAGNCTSPWGNYTSSRCNSTSLPDNDASPRCNCTSSWGSSTSPRCNSTSKRSDPTLRILCFAIGCCLLSYSSVRPARSHERLPKGRRTGGDLFFHDCHLPPQALVRPGRIEILREAPRRTMTHGSFRIDAMVVLPGHIHSSQPQRGCVLGFVTRFDAVGVVCLAFPFPG